MRARFIIASVNTRVFFCWKMFFFVYAHYMWIYYKCRLTIAPPPYNRIYINSKSTSLLVAGWTRIAYVHDERKICVHVHVRAILKLWWLWDWLAGIVWVNELHTVYQGIHIQFLVYFNGNAAVYGFSSKSKCERPSGVKLKLLVMKCGMMEYKWSEFSRRCL